MDRLPADIRPAVIRVEPGGATLVARHRLNISDRADTAQHLIKPAGIADCKQAEQVKTRVEDLLSRLPTTRCAPAPA